MFSMHRSVSRNMNLRPLNTVYWSGSGRAAKVGHPLRWRRSWRSGWRPKVGSRQCTAVDSTYATTLHAIQGITPGFLQHRPPQRVNGLLTHVALVPFVRLWGACSLCNAMAKTLPRSRLLHLSASHLRPLRRNDLSRDPPQSHPSSHHHQVHITNTGSSELPTPSWGSIMISSPGQTPTRIR